LASVLIVDDDPRIQELLLRWLRPEGHTLRFAEDANAALLALADEQPAVVVCDVHMPGANGLWLAERVRSVAPATAIVLATADETIPAYESLRRGVVGYVLKPFDRTQFVRTVSAGVDWSRAAVAQGRRAASAGRRLPAARD
jgi:DNA-binding NtrC family response regulator